ncbi:MAG: DEAD/DEAH box helicase [Candidatus Velthaea sp.]
MVFSALVDADRLDTEAFCSPASAVGRERRRASLSTLRELLEAELDRLARLAPPTTINAVRAEVRRDCLAAAARPPGIFSLTVPTGGGKTLAGLTFGLEHALNHGLERVIVAIPYTSIIEQTASVYRKLFGADAVVEHHSAIEPQHDTDANRRACENWDAPIIVTTNVQLLETLFTHRPSRARKLHALCRSVIVLDEAQTLPPQFLTPILDGLQELVGHYGASIVISTATQPALASRLGSEVTEIVSDPPSLFSALDRVEIVLPASWDQPIPNAELAARLTDEEHFLLITHRRADAQELASLIPDAFHLSAAMCGAHRQGVMRSVRKRLSAGLRCRLVSTQVVEAGVDLDFPLVLRAFGPLDAIAQAAGRCNREGRLQDASGAPRRGRFEVFCATSAPPPAQRSATDISKTVLRLRGGLSLADPTLFTEYFDRLYSNGNLDAEDIQRHRAGFRYETVGNAFELIPDRTVPIIVPYPGAAAAAAHLEHALTSGHGERQALRQVQPYIVAVPRSDHAKLFEANDLDRIGELVDVLRSDAQYAQYDRNLGLVLLSQPAGAGASTTRNGDLP